MVRKPQSLQHLLACDTLLSSSLLPVLAGPSLAASLLVGVIHQQEPGKSWVVNACEQGARTCCQEGCSEGGSNNLFSFLKTKMAGSNNLVATTGHKTLDDLLRSTDAQKQTGFEFCSNVLSLIKINKVIFDLIFIWLIFQLNPSFPCDLPPFAMLSTRSSVEVISC